jgi:CarboxypepD_reg-like domain
MGLKYICYLIVVLSFVYIFGCNNQQASYEDTGVGGTVIDSSTKKGIPGVSVQLDQAKTSTVTDSNGNYYIGKIPVPSSAGNYYLTFSKYGYNTIKSFAILYAGDTTKKVNLTMYSQSSNSVFIANNLVVTKYVNKWSLGILNLYSLFVTNDSIATDIDAVLMDSSGTNSNFAFNAGNFALPNTGWTTRFTTLLGYYSQYEFDTLSRIEVGGRPIIPGTDFPAQSTSYFNTPLLQSPVYGFYLFGRYNYDPSYPRVYGLLRIDSFYYDNISGTYKAVVDIKINRNEQNYFLLK